MGVILSRLKLIVKMWLNALLAPAKDPREVFAVAHRRQRELLDKVRHALATVAASRARLQRNSAQARNKLPELEGRARRSLVAGREDQARFALQLRQVVLEEAQALEDQIGQLDREHQTLSLVEHRLATQIETFFTRQEMLEARYSSTEAHVRIKEALSGVSEELEGLDIALERAEEKTENMQARVSAIDELVETGILEMPAGLAIGPRSSLSPGKAEDGAVEDLLGELKGELGSGDSPGPAER